MICSLHLKRTFRRLDEDAITKYRKLLLTPIPIPTLFLFLSLSHSYSIVLLSYCTICAHINFVTSENIYTLFIRRYKICGIPLRLLSNSLVRTKFSLLQIQFLLVSILLLTLPFEMRQLSIWSLFFYFIPLRPRISKSKEEIFRFDSMANFPRLDALSWNWIMLCYIIRNSQWAQLSERDSRYYTFMILIP